MTCKIYDFIKMVNLFSKTYDFRKNDKFAKQKWKGVNSERIKIKTCFADKDLSSWTGLDRSGHDQITTFGPISHVSGSKLAF